MNKRLRELANQTDVWCDQNWLGHEFYYEKWEEKFAELILRDVDSIINFSKVSYTQVEGAYVPAEIALDMTAKNVKTYFGVK
jgi:hypothetical protein